MLTIDVSGKIFECCLHEICHQLFPKTSPSSFLALTEQFTSAIIFTNHKILYFPSSMQTVSPIHYNFENLNSCLYCLLTYKIYKRKIIKCDQRNLLNVPNIALQIK